ncbi:transporter substrate-binding domain-containing protein [Microbacterium testaceum]|uniref:transporter substrate-binding domain-containing protein n=1 Tax=Microbacterium testaceum TaxID=2033 RepID=UPI001CD955B1|nr:transporter substrate-binding domain-containing protein [Microbacterium testaceum]
MTAAAVTVLMLSGCGIRIPSDPKGTLDAVEGGVLRAGVSPNGEWVRAGADRPAGIEVEVLTEFARSLGAEVEWTVGSEESLVRGLEEGDLDVVAGGITEQTPWTNKAGITRPYAEAPLDDGSSVKIVMLVPLGENAFVSRLETFLVDEAETRGIAP